MDTREETPPHHPTHGVHLSDDEIESIARACLSEPSTTYSFSRLLHGQGYNNRIYLINNTHDHQDAYVLKVNGRFFGPSKVENEVACLQILEEFCPTVPVPRVVAWSTDGCRIVLSTRKMRDLTSGSRTVNSHCRQGWMLMTRLPGEPLNPSSLTVEDSSRLSVELAKLVLRWREDVPKSDRSGNLRFRLEDGTLERPSWRREETIYDLGYDIRGILDNGMAETDPPMNSLLAYWKGKLSNRVQQLFAYDVFAPSRETLKPPLTNFIEETLPRLSILEDCPEDKYGFVFSHTDLSPRNVLLSGSPPQISGLVDFEFSGFFPWLQDFTIKSIVSEEEEEEGWPVAMHGQILWHLEELGVVTPLRLKGTIEWEELMLLVALETYIAPWWIEAGSVHGSKLDEELKDARNKVFDALSALEKKQ